MEKIDFKKKITVWNTAKETYPIRTESDKGAFVIFFSLNERAVAMVKVTKSTLLCVWNIFAIFAVEDHIAEPSHG